MQEKTSSNTRSTLMDSLYISYFLSSCDWPVNPMRKYFSDRELEGIDIDSEYELIQKKESNLSASLRRAVVRKYEQRHP